MWSQFSATYRKTCNNNRIKWTQPCSPDSRERAISRRYQPGLIWTIRAPFMRHKERAIMSCTQTDNQYSSVLQKIKPLTAARNNQKSRPYWAGKKHPSVVTTAIWRTCCWRRMEHTAWHRHHSPLSSFPWKAGRFGDELNDYPDVLEPVSTPALTATSNYGRRFLFGRLSHQHLYIGRPRPTH